MEDNSKLAEAVYTLTIQTKHLYQKPILFLIAPENIAGGSQGITEASSGNGAFSAS